MEDKRDFTNKYNTRLNPNEEIGFKKWLLNESIKQGRDLSKDLYNYDLRGAWQDIASGKINYDERGHLPDTYKKPNHPTFSDQSKYNETDGFIGGSWIEDSNGNQQFIVSPTNMYTPNELQNYFNKSEQGVGLADSRYIFTDPQLQLQTRDLYSLSRR